MNKQAVGQSIDWCLSEGGLLIGKCSKADITAEIAADRILPFQLQIWRSHETASHERPHLLNVRCVSLQYAIQLAESYVEELALVSPGDSEEGL